jgi:hypothetical protein
VVGDAHVSDPALQLACVVGQRASRTREEGDAAAHVRELERDRDVRGRGLEEEVADRLRGLSVRVGRPHRESAHLGVWSRRRAEPRRRARRRRERRTMRPVRIRALVIGGDQRHSDRARLLGPRITDLLGAERAPVGAIEPPFGSPLIAHRCSVGSHPEDGPDATHPGNAPDRNDHELGAVRRPCGLTHRVRVIDPRCGGTIGVHRVDAGCSRPRAGKGNLLAIR